jgi:hypothetical protein
LTFDQEFTNIYSLVYADIAAAAQSAKGIVAVTVAPFPEEAISSFPPRYLILSLISRRPMPKLAGCPCARLRSSEGIPLPASRTIKVIRSFLASSSISAVLLPE